MKLEYAGYGCAGLVPTVGGGSAIMMTPKSAASANDTHAGFVTTNQSYGDFDTTVDILNIAQTRTGGTPNAWETAWFSWHYLDTNNFMYFILKTNGWELGRVTDPNNTEAQVFLATGESPTVVFGQAYQLRVRQIGTTMTVWINGAHIVTHTDPEAYTNGKFGFYTEDAKVVFDNLDPKPATSSVHPPLALTGSCTMPAGASTTDYSLTYLGPVDGLDRYKVKNGAGVVIDESLTIQGIKDKYPTYPGSGYVIPMTGTSPGRNNPGRNSTSTGVHDLG